ncbi:hypothetical protein CURE108131_23130 [Cupriavidus respiraculi]|uniref:Uncharacterized protein n=1 Tax=Cupriavidus respiraculi TaxID=195930 RepID=A0ABN7YJA7_9BURK|nr:hypothetical protein [Cupriavidus respiraculi]CAG9172426.1 hypothetical protein LMG21510_01970 [Cupriavidus respiraculi]
MAGKPGRSGGARPGAGRPPKEPDILAIAATYDDPLKFLKAVMNDVSTDAKMRVDAAKAMLPYTHQKLGEGGKKDQRQEAAKQVASRFAAAAPPKLVAAGGKKV